MHGIDRQGFEVDGGEAPLAGAPVGAALDEFGSCQGQDEDRDVPAPLEQVIDEVEEPGVGMMQVFEDHDDRARGRKALEEGPPGAEELLRADARFDAEQREDGRLDPRPLRLVRHVLLEHGRDGHPGRRLVGTLLEPGTTADHLAERPERDAIAIGGAAAVVPPDALDETVDVLQELPGQARLADAGRPHDADQAGSAFTAGGVEVVLELAKLLVTTDEGRLERFRPSDPATLRHDAHRSPGRDRAALALQDLVLGSLEGDGARGRSLRRLADQHGRRWGHALEAAGRVDHVARDHALIRGAQRDRRFTGQDAGPDLDARAEAADGVDEVEGGSHRSLSVVLTGDRGAPDRHHGIADEFLDGAAVAGDDLADRLEIARLELPDLLRIAVC